MFPLSLLPISSSAGNLLHHGKGVIRYVSRAIRRSRVSFKRFFTVLTVRSTCPLLCGNKELLVICSNPYTCAKCLNCSDVNCGPLSLLTISGIPNLEKVSFMESIIVVEVVLLTLCTSGYLEK